MDKFFLQETEFTPEISFDPEKRVFTIQGVSRPENVMMFFQPVINWLKEYHQLIINQPTLKFSINSIKLIFKLSYFNSASSKMLLQLLENIRQIQNTGIEINVDWYYDNADDQMREDGEDLSSAVDIPFNYIEIVE